MSPLGIGKYQVIMSNSGNKILHKQLFGSYVVYAVLTFHKRPSVSLNCFCQYEIISSSSSPKRLI